MVIAEVVVVMSTEKEREKRLFFSDLKLKRLISVVKRG